MRSQAPQPHSRSIRPRRGFTLVEILMVVVIIAILAAILLPVVNSAFRTANSAAVSTEIGQLSTAVESFKQEYGMYPPTMSYANSGAYMYADSGGGDIDEYNEHYGAHFMQHIRRMFPRFTGNAQVAIETAATTALGRSVSLETMDPAESIVFFLGGIPRQAGNTYELLGFSQDPSDPFNPAIESRKPVFFEFNPGRLVDLDDDGWPEYVPDAGNPPIDTPPYVYFEAEVYDDLPFYPTRTDLQEKWGIISPYLTSITLTGTVPNDEFQLYGAFPDATKTLANPRSFQIISAGLDNEYTAPLLDRDVSALAHFLRIASWGRRVPGGTESTVPPAALPALHLSEHDNLTNFSTGTLDSGFNPPQ